MRRTTKKGCLLVFGMVCMLSLGGCQGGSVTSGKEADTTAAETTEAVTEAPEWSEESQLELYNNYIDVYNYMVGRLNDSLTRYFEYVEAAEEFALLEPEGDYYDCYTIADHRIKTLDETYSLVQEKPEQEQDALDKAFIDMYPSLSQLYGCLNDIAAYTDEKSFREDGYGKAKEYHAVLWPAFNEYLEKASVFEEELNTVAAQQGEDSLNQLKEEGLEALYNVNVLLNNAQALQIEFAEEGIYDDNILDMDLEKVRPLYDAFIESVNTVREMANDEEKMAQGGISARNPWWHSFMSDMGYVETSITKVMEKVEAGTPLSQSDTIVTIPGHCSLTSFYEGISSLINDYNNLIKF